MTCAQLLLAFAVVVGAVVAPLNTAGARGSESGVALQTAPAAVDPSDPLATPTAPNTDDPDAAMPTSLAVELVPAAFGILRPGVDLTASVTLSNRTATAVAAGTARLYLAREATDDHLELAEWIATDPADYRTPDEPLLTEVATPALEPGQSVVLPNVVVPAAAIVVADAASFGAHRLEVRVSGSDAEVVGDRSSVVLVPAQGGLAASVAMVLPLTVPSETVGLIPAEQLAQLTGPGGTLERELDQADGRAIALAIDPRIILSIRVLGTSAPASATAWLDRLDRSQNVTFPLAYADSDVAATSQLGVGILEPSPIPLDPELFPATIDPTGAPDVTGAPGDAIEPSTSPSPSPSPSDPAEPTAPTLPTLDELLAWDYTRDDIVWPRELSVVATDLDTFASVGLTTAVLSSENVEANPGSSSPAAQLGAHDGLITDATVSALFREAVTATTTPQWESAVVRLTGSLAALADEGADGGVPALTVASLARDSASGSFRLAETLDVIRVNSWAAAAPLTSALSAAPEAATLIDTPTAPARRDQLQAGLVSEAQAAGFASVVVDPAVVTGERRLALLALSSQSWATDDAAFTEAVNSYLARTTEITGSVQVDTTGSITVLADNGDLPISVSNVLDVPVTVYVTVTSPRPLLAVREERVPVTVEANSQRRASIPVQSIANGEVTIAIALTSGTGVAIGQPASADVTVRAGWETAATTVLGVIVGLVFIAGIVRTVRRQRRGRSSLTADRPAESEPADA